MALRCRAEGTQAVSVGKAVAKHRSNPEGNTFILEDHKGKLLLVSTLEYKIKEPGEGADWVSMKMNYHNIYEVFCEAQRREL